MTNTYGMDFYESSRSLSRNILDGKVNIDRVWQQLVEPLYNDSSYKPKEYFTLIFSGINPSLPPDKHRHTSTLRAALYGIRSYFASCFARYSRSGQNDHELDWFKENILGDKDKVRRVRGLEMSAIGKSA